MRTAQKQKYADDKLVKRLHRKTGQAIGDFNMISAGDRIMVCLSGGKDSYAMLDILLALQQRAPVDFELVAVNLDQKQPGFPEQVLPTYLAGRGVPFEVIEQDTYSVVRRVIREGKTTCGLCSRLRRGALYRYAGEHGFTKIALGHHRDDIIETLFLNLFNGGRIKAMPPKLLSDDGRHVVIRPLAYCSEEDLRRYAELRDFPLIPCDLCGSQPNLQRQVIKEMLTEWKRRHPGRVENIFRAIGHVSPSQLADHELFDFRGLGAVGEQPSVAGEDWLRPPATQQRPDPDTTISVTSGAVSAPRTRGVIHGS
ncbi:tRNA 2-thiocytidine(32) synthetase TtcA [Elongatibacter sediminis]|uniref:tRNA-cytidine(32) 2-sulfurtransferase n=1 Tax=Elongatibacter sediminis TaxID=3119006 RepID=A0AAW9RAP8_9GAMM